MSQIIAARFNTFAAADEAKDRLLASGFFNEDITEFFVTPSGQHARYPIGGDTYADPQAKPAGLGATGGGAIGAIAGVVVAGLLTLTLFHSLLTLIVATAVCAYVGSLLGALLLARGGKKTVAPAPPPSLEERQGPHERESGVLLAVHVGSEQRPQVTQMLLDAHGKDVEEAEGLWERGRWADFDPTRMVRPARATAATQ